MGIAKIGKEFPYIQKVEKMVRKSPINFPIPELPKLVRNSPISKTLKNGKEIPYKISESMPVHKNDGVMMPYWTPIATCKNC